MSNTEISDKDLQQDKDLFAVNKAEGSLLLPAVMDFEKGYSSSFAVHCMDLRNSDDSRMENVSDSLQVQIVVGMRKGSSTLTDLNPHKGQSAGSKSQNPVQEKSRDIQFVLAQTENLFHRLVFFRPNMANALLN